MALEFRRKRFHKPGHKWQLALALLVLAVALCFAAVWISVNLLIDAPDKQEPTSVDSTPETVYSAEDVRNLLIILRGETNEQFVILRFDPVQAAVSTVTLPAETLTAEGVQLGDVLHKNGEAAVTAQVSRLLQLPIRHYIAFSREQLQKWFEYLGNDLDITLDSSVQYRSDDGQTILMENGPHTINAKTVTQLLLNGVGSTPLEQTELTSHILATMVNQYLSSGRSLSGDFSHIADESKTSLRIGDFNDYRSVLSYLAERNGGNICKAIRLYGSANSSGVVLDVDALRKTPLFAVP